MDAILIIILALYFVFTVRPTVTKKVYKQVGTVGVWQADSSLEKDEQAWMKIYNRLMKGM